MLNTILLDAIEQKASDIHFEPTGRGLEIRFRQDGVLNLKHALPADIQNQMITRIKVLSRLDIAEHRLPQDGRMKLKVGGKEIDFRVSTIPVVFGERIVLRILDKSQVVLGLDRIGMPVELLKVMKGVVRQNQGIILVTGPTGSGKTTTLYSSLFEIDARKVNIMTIEDPVEFKLPSMAQIGVNPKIGLTFARGLRHILRQDPDVVMIGEIRDHETAEIATQASMTGHLVLSTLHTNDAPSAIARLIDMGVEPYLLSSSLLLVLAQRLVRKICGRCSVPYEPDEEEKRELGIAAGIRGNFRVGKGCSECYHTGYKGRIGLYEYMPITHAIKHQLLISPDASRLGQIALEEGMVSLRQRGIELVLRGETTIEEVVRVTRAIDEEWV